MTSYIEVFATQYSEYSPTEYKWKFPPICSGIEVYFDVVFFCICVKTQHKIIFFY